MLVALLGAPPAVEVLLHRRSARLLRHARQVAFPGGVADPGDVSPAATALREAEEELGLPPSRVVLVGRLSDQRTTTGYVVTPVVGLVPGGAELTPRAAEVEEVLRVPLAALLAPGGFRTSTRTVRGLRISGDVMVWKGEEIWGATARILLALRRVTAAARDGSSGPLSVPVPGAGPGPTRRAPWPAPRPSRGRG